jgi:hypothetical protein
MRQMSCVVEETQRSEVLPNPNPNLTLTQAGIAALGRLHIWGSTDSMGRLKDAGLCEAVVASMVAHYDHLALQSACILEMNQLLVADCAFAVAFGAAGVCEALMTVMREHVAAVAVQTGGAKMARLLADSYNLSKLVDAGLFEVLVAGTQAHALSAFAQSQVWYCVQILVEKYKGDSARLIDAGLCEAVVVSIHTHMPSAQVQTYCAQAVVALAMHNSVCRARLVDAGVCGALVTTMSVRPAVSHVLYYAAKALQIFAEERARKVNAVAAFVSRILLWLAVQLLKGEDM